MAEFVYGKKTQKTCYEQYTPPADVRVCSRVILPNPARCEQTNGIDDWTPCKFRCAIFSSPYYNTCCKPDPGICPQIGAAAGVPLWAGDNPSANTPGKGGVCTPATTTDILCRYPVSAFTTAADVGLFNTTFVNDPTNSTPNRAFSLDQLNTQLLPSYCFQSANPGECPASVAGITGPSCPTGLAGCSKVVSTGTDGNLCSPWYNNFKDIGDAAAGTYCAANTCAIDCRCYNRLVVDDIYIQVSKAAPPGIKDGCWYAPCKNFPPIFVQPTADPGTGPSVCPTTICSQINEFINNNINNFNINNLNQDISCCNGTCGGGANGGGGNTMSFWAQYGSYILVGLAVLVVVIVIIIIISVVTTSNRNKPDVPVAVTPQPIPAVISEAPPIVIPEPPPAVVIPV